MAFFCSFIDDSNIMTSFSILYGMNYYFLMERAVLVSVLAHFELNIIFCPLPSLWYYMEYYYATESRDVNDFFLMVEVNWPLWNTAIPAVLHPPYGCKNEMRKVAKKVHDFLGWVGNTLLDFIAEFSIYLLFETEAWILPYFSVALKKPPC